MTLYSAPLSKLNTYKKIADGIVGYHLLLTYYSAENCKIFFFVLLKKKMNNKFGFDFTGAGYYGKTSIRYLLLYTCNNLFF